MEEIDLKELFSFIKDKLGLLITITSVICLIGCIYGLFIQTPLYQSDTTVILSSSETTLTQNDLNMNKNLVDTYAEIVKSRRVLEQVIDELNLEITYNQLHSKILVSSVNNTEIILNKDNFVLYLGFPTCPWCRNIVPVLFEVASENKVEEVYYINVRELKNSGEDYKNLFELISDYLEADEDGEKVLYVPEVFFFQEGKIIGHHLGSVDSQTNPNNPLTEIIIFYK